MFVQSPFVYKIPPGVRILTCFDNQIRDHLFCSRVRTNLYLSSTMGKSGRGKGTAVKKLSVQKQHELKVLINKLLSIDIDRKASNQELFQDFVDLRKVVDEVQSIENEIKVRSGSGSGDSRMKHMPAFLQWIAENGGLVDNIDVVEFPGFGLGLRANKSFKKDEPMITIPRKLFMSLDNATLLSEPYLTEIPFPPTINVKLAFWLIVEKLNPKSFYRPYLDTLPERIPNFLQYSVAEMQELKGSSAMVYAIHQVKKFLRMFAVMHRFVEQSTHPSLEQVRQRFSYELYR